MKAYILVITAWVVTSVAVCVAMSYTHTANPLFFLIFPTAISMHTFDRMNSAINSRPGEKPVSEEDDGR